MIYVVFEAGSRAGLSARYLFEWYLKLNPSTEDKLILVDSDEVFSSIYHKHGTGVIPLHESLLETKVNFKNEVTVFPADEISRQSGHCENLNLIRSSIWMASPQYYDKSYVNYMLKEDNDSEFLPPCMVPETFDMNSVCVKPNKMSAGSKGVQFFDNMCISEKIEIQNEYVIDVLRNNNGQATYYGRQVKLRAGYDKYIKFLPHDHGAITAAMYLVRKAHEKSTISGLFSRIFHVQIAEDIHGQFWFIEASKRISGTSLVNILCGFNPFEFIKTGKSIWIKPADVDFDSWYRYEDLLEKVILKLRS